MGAINAAFLSGFPQGQEKDAATKLIDLWKKMKSKDIYKSWIGGFVQGFTLEAGLYNLKPKTFLNKIVPSKFYRKFDFAVTNFNNSQFMRFNENLKRDQIIELLAAAIAYPVQFP